MWGWSWSTRIVFTANQSTILRNPRVRDGGRHHRQAAVHCKRDNGSHTSHCERRRGYKSSARAARARCERTNTTTASDCQMCHGPRARRGHPCETACVKAAMDRWCTSTKTWHVGGRRWSRRRDNWRSKKINDCWTFNGKVVVKIIDGVVKEIRSDVDLTGLNRRWWLITYNLNLVISIIS